MIEQGTQLDAFHSLNLLDIVADFIYGLFNPGTSSTSAWAAFTESMADFFAVFLSKVHMLSLFVSLLLFLGLLYSRYRLDELRREDKKKWAEIVAASNKAADPKDAKNTRWERVLAHADSSNLADWRLAILEADIMLDELLDSKGYRGQSIGDKLKSVEPGDCKTLNEAWEAHKIRNAIAHEGGEFELSQHEARRVIELYRQVFSEFNFI